MSVERAREAGGGGIALARYAAARRELAAARSVDEIKEISDRAAGLAEYARRTRDPELIAFLAKLQNLAAERLGEIMTAKRSAGELAEGTRGSTVKGARVLEKPALADQGVDKHLGDRRAGPDAGEISKLLADRIEPLCRELLPNGRWEKASGSWRVGSLSGEKGSSLSIRLKGKPGQWFDFATDEKGDALGLVEAVLGLDMVGALRWSRQWLGIDQGTGAHQRPAMDEEARRQRDADRAAREASQREEDARRLAFALNLFDEAHAPHGTDTERYLNARKLKLPFGADAIRHHPHCAFRDENVPCMIALFRHNLTDEPVGIQRTRLPPSGWVRGMKMERLNLGPTRTGSIKIDCDADVLYGFTIGEGTETVLAGRMLGYRPAWATGGKGTIRQFPLLPEPVQSLSVHWEFDADADMRECAERWCAAGREVIVLKSLFGKDAADALWEGP